MATWKRISLNGALLVIALLASACTAPEENSDGADARPLPPALSKPEHAECSGDRRDHDERQTATV